MHERYQTLLELQDLDQEIHRADQALGKFAPELDNLEAPVVALEKEITALRDRASEMRQNSRRLERAANEKRDKLQKYEERLNKVRNAREEAAVRTEVDLVRRAAEADEQEALELMEQTTRAELKQDELERELTKARAEVEPKRQELLEARAALEHELAVLRDRRQNHVVRLEPVAIRLYERVRAGRSRRVLAPLLADGACGSCYSLIPIQRQTEIRRADQLMRCEACGVILYPTD